MKLFLESIIKQLGNYSKSLNIRAILTDKPWTLIDSDLEIQRLIFKKNHQLIMSKDGQVQIGAWEYLPEAKSLLLDRGKDKILCNEGFIDEGVLVMKLDGTKNKFFVLANENIVPDLNPYEYLKKLKNRKLNIITRKLENGKIIEIERHDWQRDENNILIGNKVTIDYEKIADGEYCLADTNMTVYVEEGVIFDITHLVTYIKNGLEIEIEQYNQDSVEKGDFVWINGKEAKSGKYKIGFGEYITVKNGEIIKKTLF